MNKVSIVKCADYHISNIEKALESLFNEFGGISEYIKPGMKVALKPNLVMKKKPEEAATTHPSIVEALSRMIIRQGADVIIAESPGGLYTEKALREVYRITGMEGAAKNSGASLNFDITEVELDNEKAMYIKKLAVIKPLVDADFIINLPKLKTHGMMVYTGAVKNMFGVIPGVIKAEYHLRMSDYDAFANALIDIYLSVKPGFHIMDAVISMDGNGPSAGTPNPTSFMMGAENGFSMDYVAIKAVGIAPDRVPVVARAIDRGLCEDDIDLIDIKGEPLEQILISNFKVPQLDTLREVNFRGRGVPQWLIRVLRPRPFFVKTRCIGCGICADNCPSKVISIVDKKPQVDLSACIRCFCCQELCPAKAVKIKRSLLAKIIIESRNIINRKTKNTA